MINNEARYEAAKQRNIRNNRRVGAHRRWVESNPNAERAENFLFGAGEFANVSYVDADGEERSSIHPTRKAAFGGFFSKMADTLAEWGALSDNQTDAVITMIDRAEDRIAKRAKENARMQAASKHVGTIGERIDITGTIVFVVQFTGRFGFTYLTGIKDRDGNILIQKGVSIGKQGDELSLKATVKAHEVRDGVNQTIITRPKVI